MFVSHRLNTKKSAPKEPCGLSATFARAPAASGRERRQRSSPLVGCAVANPSGSHRKPFASREGFGLRPSHLYLKSTPTPPLLRRGLQSRYYPPPILRLQIKLRSKGKGDRTGANSSVFKYCLWARLRVRKGVTLSHSLPPATPAVAAVLKTVDLHGSGGSNPSLSASSTR